MATITTQEAAEKLMYYQQNGFYVEIGHLRWDAQDSAMLLTRRFRTGWTCNGYPVCVNALVVVNAESYFDGKGDFDHIIEAFYAHDPNAKKDYDITDQLQNQQLYLQDCQGNYGQYKQAFEFIRMISFYASLFPHVMTCDEFIEVEGVYCSRHGYRKPTADIYLKEYLPMVEQDFRKGVFYVGAITQVSDLSWAYHTAGAERQPQGQPQGQPQRQPQGRSSNAGSYYRQMQQEGFSVSFVMEHAGYDGRLSRTEFFSTPWQAHGHKVEVAAMIDFDSMEVRNIEYTEIGWAEHETDITKKLERGRIFLTDAAGQIVDLSQANALVTEMTRNTCRLPYVRLFDDYMEVESLRAREQGGPQPTLDSYLNEYLPQMERALQDPSNVFVGDITTPDEVNIARDMACNA